MPTYAVTYTDHDGHKAEHHVLEGQDLPDQVRVLLEAGGSLMGMDFTMLCGQVPDGPDRGQLLVRLGAQLARSHNYAMQEQRVLARRETAKAPRRRVSVDVLAALLWERVLRSPDDLSWTKLSDAQRATLREQVVDSCEAVGLPQAGRPRSRK